MRVCVPVLFATFVLACGDTREQPAPDPVEQPPVGVADDRHPAESAERVGLGDEERQLLEKRFAAEAVDQITSENAAEVGKRLLVDVERELAAERAAADAGAD